MNDEEMKRLWREQRLEPGKLSPGDQVKLMRIKMKALDRATLWVDILIVTLVAGLILFFAWTLLKAQPVVASIGLLITIGILAVWIWEPIRARHSSPRMSADATVANWLRHEVEKIHTQNELKRTRLWTILPLWIGEVVFTWGLDTHLSARVFFSSVLTCINLVILVVTWKLNAYTWRKADLPMIEELESLLRSSVTE